MLTTALSLVSTVISMELQSFEKPYVTLLKSANRVYKQPIVEDIPYTFSKHSL
jgi:hypothetical protein